MTGSATDYKSGPGPSIMKKLGTETMIKKCVTTYYSRQDFKPNETQSTDNESQRGSLLQVMIGDIVIENDNNQKEVDDENPSIDHVQKPTQVIGVRLNETPNPSADHSLECRARKSLLKQSQQQHEPDAIVEIATKYIRSADPSEDYQIPGPPEIRTIEQRAKSAEATRLCKERETGVCNSSIKQAKTAAQRNREYRARKKLEKTMMKKQESDQHLDAKQSKHHIHVSTTSPQVNQNAGPSIIKSTSPYNSCTVHCNKMWFKNNLEKAPYDHEDLLKKTTKPLEPRASHSDRESTTTSSLHTDYDIPVEEHIIKTENESDNNEEWDPGEEESAKSNLQPCLVTVKIERDGSCSDTEDLPLAVGDKMGKDNYISTTDVSKKTAKNLVEQLGLLKQKNSYGAFGRAIQIEVVADVNQHQQQMQQQLPRIMQSKQTRPYSNAERQKRYREKKKADKMNACTIFSQSNDAQPQPQQEQPQYDVQINKSQPQSSAERQRKYRKLLRERQQQQQKMEDLNLITVPSNTPDTSSSHKLRKGSLLQVMIGDIVTEHDNNQKEVDDENPSIDHVQKPTQVIGVRLNETPNPSADHSLECRARKSMLKQSQQQHEPDAIVEIATKYIRSADPSEDYQIPGPPEIRTIEQRAKSAEATRLCKERETGVCNSSIKQAKTAAQRNREYRARKKLEKTMMKKQESDQHLAAKQSKHHIHKPLEPRASHSDRESTTTSSLHTDYDIPVEEHIIKTENESDNNEEWDPGEEESAKPNLQPCLVTVKIERDGSWENY